MYRHRLKEYGWNKDICYKIMHKKAEGTILIPDKINFKKKVSPEIKRGILQSKRGFNSSGRYNKNKCLCTLEHRFNIMNKFDKVKEKT